MSGRYFGSQTTPTLDLGAEQRTLMTIRVSRDSGRTWVQTTAVREGDPMRILADPMRFPACECARCGGRASVAARALRPVATAGPSW
ncbi:hypothetical protein [Streptomyces sp. CC228A]|uniref:hypothetical protein n=1 Tax=Streptomyces sp. CC228A TaxID=2898186 RepID=UPI001F3536EF|nr:hypothetical protein [Streptomyces sp. CC228A]